MGVRKLRTVVLQAHEPVRSSTEWQAVQRHINEAIAAIVWPPGATTFTIRRYRGRASGDLRNGVKPIRDGFMKKLQEHGWIPEVSSVPDVGDVDGALTTDIGVFAMEWETGNISSSHRSLNRLAKGLLTGSIVGGILVLPSRALYNHLTDRIGNFQEIEPYFDYIWKRLPIEQGVLIVVEVEHDAISDDVERISQGTDGMSLVRRARAQDAG